MKNNILGSLTLCLVLSAVGCYHTYGENSDLSMKSEDRSEATSIDKSASRLPDLPEGMYASLVMDGLINPSGVTFSEQGELTVVNAGAGEVLVPARSEGPFISDFQTEFWKPGAFKLGPLSAQWIGSSLFVSDAGLADGEDMIRRFEAAGSASDGTPSNSVGPTSRLEIDKGEGNLTGFARSPSGRYIWVCGQGSDAGTWVLRYNVATNKLEPWLSADAHNVAVNSPMQALPLSETRLLVLYSGTGGVADGTIVEWDVTSAKLTRVWQLHGLIDPMGMALIPGEDNVFAVVDNNWAIDQVLEGKLARVTLPLDGGDADIEVLSESLRGPVSCAFAPDGSLYITQLGEAFDEPVGQVLRVTGW